MVVLISLVKELVSPPRKPCLDSGSQSASHSVVTITNNENQFLDPSQGNQFAIPSCGAQLSTIPLGSFDFGQVVPIAPNPASLMATAIYPQNLPKVVLFLPSKRWKEKSQMLPINDIQRTHNPFC